MLAVKETAIGENEFTFERDVQPKVGLINFHPSEDGFVWSMAKWCEIKFFLRVPRGGHYDAGIPDLPMEIALDVDAFKAPPDLTGQNVFFYVNGMRLASRLITGRITVMLELPPFLVRQTENIITIDTPDAACPVSHGQGDTRTLGIQVFSVRISHG